MKYLALFGFSSFLVRVVAQVVPTSGDPLQTFTSLGIGGSLAIVVYFWQRDTAKQRDKAMDALAEATKGLEQVKQSVDRAAAVHERGSEVTSQMVDLMKGMPPRETWVHITDALERLRLAEDRAHRDRER